MPLKRKQTIEPEFIGLADAAALIGVCPMTIRRYIRDGKLQGYRHGTALLRVRIADVRALLTPDTHTG